MEPATGGEARAIRAQACGRHLSEEFQRIYPRTGRTETARKL